MNLRMLINTIQTLFPTQENYKATLFFGGTEHPIRRIADENGLCISTFPETDDTITFTLCETLSCLKSLGILTSGRNSFDEEVIIRMTKDSYSFDESRTLTIESVTRQDDKLLISGRYIEPGDHLLLEFQDDSYLPTYIAGTVKCILFPFTENEEMILESAYYANREGFIDIHCAEPLMNRAHYHFHDSSGQIGHIFSRDEWDALREDVQTYLILKDMLPFVKEDLLVDTLNVLKQKKSYVNIF